MDTYNIIIETTPNPSATDLTDALAEYRASGHTDAVRWTVEYHNRAEGAEALWLPALGRVGICAGGNSDWGDCDSEADLAQCIEEYHADAEAWEARN